MKTLTFEYTKPSGLSSFRTLIPFVSPAIFYEGLDVSHLGADELTALSKDLDKIQLDYQQKLEEVKSKYNLQDMYKRFNPDGISELKYKYY